MKTIATLVTHGYYPGRPDRDQPEYVQDQLDLMTAALAPFEIKVEPAFWQDDGTDWQRFDGVLPILAWNYPQQVDVFLTRLDEIEAADVMLMNDNAVIKANIDKGYLADLANRGAPVPPTISVDVCTPELIISSFDHFDTDEVIVKPRIGAGAWRQARIKRGEPCPSADVLPPAAALIQPFLQAVTREGEMSLLYFGGVFSHALIKTPKAGDYRTQGQYGALELNISPPADALAAAEAVLAKAQGAPFTYARVDLVRGPTGAWLLMELELIEPWLYLPQDGHGGHHGAALFAKTIAARLEGQR
jgi:glutathione synthase/RimK-type ligase-like ATP-grasp enzyme